MTYEKLPLWLMAGARPWIRFDPGRLPRGVAAVLGGSNPTPTPTPTPNPSGSDPSKALEMLLGAGKVTEVGRRTVRGEPTTQYRIDYYDFGAEVDVKVPPASQVTDVSELVGQA